MGNVRGHITVRRAAKPGADGKSVELIFKTTSTETPPSTPISEQVDNYVPAGWSGSPEDISNSNPYLFMCKRVSVNSLWGEYSTPAIWSKYSGVEPKAVTRAQLLTLMSEGMLDAGSKYMITDHPNDMGIIVEAVSSSLIDSKAVRLGCKPRYYTVGTYGEEAWKGVLHHSAPSADVGGIYVYAGMVYRNLTGEINVDPGQDNYKLSDYDWELIPPAWGPYYSPNICECTYLIALTETPETEPCGAVLFMTDNSGNTYGEVLSGEKTLEELVRIDYNDWGHPGISNTQVTHCWGNTSDCVIYKTTGKLYLFQNKACTYSNLRCGEEMDSETFPYLWNSGNVGCILRDCDISGHLFRNTNINIKKSAILNSLYDNASISGENLTTHGKIYNNANCVLSSFRIMSADSYVAACEYLEITNSSLSGISWIERIAGTSENKVVISGSEIGGEIEDLGAGFIIEDVVIGKSGDVRRIGAGYIIESQIDGDFKDISTLTVEGSHIGTQHDPDVSTDISIDDWGSVNIKNSNIGASFQANMSNDPGTHTLSIINSIILPGTTLYEGDTSITSSTVGGKFRGTALNSFLEADYQGSVEDSILFKVSVTCPYIEGSRIYADLNAAGCYNTIIHRGASVYTDGSGGFNDCIIHSTAEINMRSSAATVFTRCKIGGKISQFGLSEMTYFNDCVMDYGAVIDDHSVKEYNNCRFKKNFHVSDMMLVPYKIYDSVLDGNLSLGAISSDVCFGKVGASAYVSGEIEITSSSSVYMNGVYNSGGVPQVVKSNGITITNSTGLMFTVEYSGWYKVEYAISAFAASKGLLDTKAYIIGAPDVAIPQSYIGLVYPANTEMATSSIRFTVYLESGQSVVFRYRQNYTAALSVQIANLVLSIEKEII